MGDAFTLREAREAGLQRWHLRSRRSWMRLGPGIYAPARQGGETLVKLSAAARRLPGVAAFGGLTAAWLHGIDVEPCEPIEVIVPKGAGVSARSGMRVYRSALDEAEVEMIRGRRATRILRTLEDVGRRLSTVEATVILDMALHGGLLEKSQFVDWARTRTGGRGLVNLRRVALLGEPKTESRMETLFRLVIVQSGLPVPEAQVEIYDDSGDLVARVDFYYRRQRLALEYDGAIHKDQLAEDNRRQNRLMKLGIRLLRFTAGDVLSHPAVVVSQVRAMLAG